MQFPPEPAQCGPFAALPSMDCVSYIGWLKEAYRSHTYIWRRYDLPTLPLSSRRRSFYGLGGQMALFEMRPYPGLREQAERSGASRKSHFLKESLS